MVLSVVIKIIDGLRKKFVNSSLAYKTCSGCKKEYPRDKNYFYERKNSSLTAIRYDTKCIACENKRTMKWKTSNKTKKQLGDLRYYMTDKGYFNQLWQGIVNSKHGNEFKSEEEFFNCWEEQKKIWGLKCPICPVSHEMTMIKGKGGPTGTNVSKDRILSSRSYSKQNVIFVCWRINNMKSDLTPKIAKRYLEIVKERYGTDDLE